MTIKCSKCHGKGRVQLPKVLRQTLAAVLCNAGVGISATDVRDVYFASLGVTAINNRLEELRRLALVTRQGTRRGYRYFPKTATK